MSPSARCTVTVHGLRGDRARFGGSTVQGPCTTVHYKSNNIRHLLRGTVQPCTDRAPIPLCTHGFPPVGGTVHRAGAHPNLSKIHLLGLRTTAVASGGEHPCGGASEPGKSRRTMRSGRPNRWHSNRNTIYCQYFGTPHAARRPSAAHSPALGDHGASKQRPAIPAWSRTRSAGRCTLLRFVAAGLWRANAQTSRRPIGELKWQT